MATEFSSKGAAPNFQGYRFPTDQLPPTGHGSHNSFDATATHYGSEKPNGRGDKTGFPTIMMRHLSLNTSQDSLRSMLLFSQDCIGVDFVSQHFAEDNGYLTAVASFRTTTGAEEACAKLDGKPNANNDGHMLVEAISLTPNGRVMRLNPFESREGRSSDQGPIGSTGQLSRASSKFNSTFQALDRVSPPRMSSFGNRESGRTDQSYQHSFSPQSPIGHPLERQRVSGKSVIGEDGVDDDTGKLLHDPVAYAQNENIAPGGRKGSDGGNNPHPGPIRRSTMPHIPTSRFASLTLNSPAPVPSPTSGGLVSPRGGPMQSPTSFGQPGMPPYSPPGGANGGSSYPLPSPPFMHPTFPPVNPADQNPPCNTLYVGNLPIDTSEDELKALFSKQRGYRRLCFRTKGNGPMCFVEFEDISFATKALKELYGWPLSNSVKGGIRLSFSKNPLGVRTGQANSSGLPSPMSPHSAGGPGSAGLGGMGSGMPGGFSTANGPPPGIPTPPGFINTKGANAGTMNGGPMAGGPLSAPLSSGFGGLMTPTGNGHNMANSPMRSPSVASGWGAPSGSTYGDFLAGR